MIEESPVHPDIADMPLGTIIPFPPDILPEDWSRCDGRTILEEDAAEFVWLMHEKFGKQEYTKMDQIGRMLSDTLKAAGFRAYPHRTILPNFVGQESEVAFGQNISGINVVIAIRTHRMPS